MHKFTWVAIVCLIVSIACFTMGALILSYKFTDYKEDQCIVDGCVEVTFQCQQCSDFFCQSFYYANCSVIWYNYTLEYNGDTYTKQNWRYEGCPDDVTCYYRRSDVNNTLTDEEYERAYASWELGISISLIILGVAVIVAAMTFGLLLPPLYEEPRQTV